jgi:hypothetical protein
MQFNDALCGILANDLSVFIIFMCSYRRQFLEMRVLKIGACMPACIFVVFFNVLCCNII